jgi:hypothetical protein
MATTIVAVLLGVAVLMPPRLRQFSAASLVLLGGSAAIFLVLCVGEQVRARFGVPRPLPTGSMTLTSISLSIIVLISLSLPGGSGDVQLWIDDPVAMFVFSLRCATMLALPCSLLLCSSIGKVRLDQGKPTRFGWLIIGIATYVIAWYLFLTREFFPLV